MLYEVITTEGVFIEATGGYAAKEYKRTRTASFQMGNSDPVTGPVKSRYDGHELSGGVMVGYDRPIKNVTFGPRASLDWNYNAFDA